MQVEYVFVNEDAQFRAQSLIRALFDVEFEALGPSVGLAKHWENDTVVVSDSDPAFYIFPVEKSKCGNIGWRNCAKDAGLVFLQRLVDVKKISERAEFYYEEYVNGPSFKLVEPVTSKKKNKNEQA